jgi:hypothetical protein
MKKILLLIPVLVVCVLGYAQNYTSSNNGNFSTGSNWTGGAAPATSGQSYGTINIYHNLTISGNYSITGGTIVNVYGTLTISGDASLNADMRIHPGGRLLINGSATVVNSQNLVVGTNVNPPPYADLIIMQNLISTGGGDIELYRNARVAVFGNFTNSGGGTTLTVNNGGQMYIHGNISLVNGADIYNTNSSNPYGLYVNGSISNSTGGATTTGNLTDRATLQSTNVPFYNWVNGFGPLPVTLTFFKIEKASAENVSLVWATASEENFDRFVIEHTLDGQTFNEIGSVKGAGNSASMNHYSFEDQSPVLGKSYYRLKSIDFDGYTEYFNIVAVNIEGATTFSAYPSPSNGQSINIQMNFKPSAQSVVKIIDSNGGMVMESKVSSFDNFIRFSKDLRPGIYSVLYISGNTTEKSTRFTVE